jgi:hypothetical protein
MFGFQKLSVPSAVISQQGRPASSIRQSTTAG